MCIFKDRVADWNIFVNIMYAKPAKCIGHALHGINSEVTFGRIIDIGGYFISGCTKSIIYINSIVNIRRNTNKFMFAAVTNLVAAVENVISTYAHRNEISPYNTIGSIFYHVNLFLRPMHIMYTFNSKLDIKTNEDANEGDHGNILYAMFECTCQ